MSIVPPSLLSTLQADCRYAAGACCIEIASTCAAVTISKFHRCSDCARYVPDSWMSSCSGLSSKTCLSRVNITYWLRRRDPSTCCSWNWCDLRPPSLRTRVAAHRPWCSSLTIYSNLYECTPPAFWSWVASMYRYCLGHCWSSTAWSWPPSAALARIARVPGWTGIPSWRSLDCRYSLDHSLLYISFYVTNWLCLCLWLVPLSHFCDACVMVRKFALFYIAIIINFKFIFNLV